MENTPFIITITGPSASGKTFITNNMVEVGERLEKDEICFEPTRFAKFVTRAYRDTEIVDRNKGRNIDVEHVFSIPEDCEFVYKTYGEEYGLRADDLQKQLDNGTSPVVVINDVRVVSELKKEFPGKVLSLFLFRQIIPDEEAHAKAGRDRGAEKQVLSRFEKAVALYRVFIERLFKFDRVILNVDNPVNTYQSIEDMGAEKFVEEYFAEESELSIELKESLIEEINVEIKNTVDENSFFQNIVERICCITGYDHESVSKTVRYIIKQNYDVAYIQPDKLIKGVFNGKVDLYKRKKKGAKLFIISGNAQSGKDELIKATKKMGVNQSNILVKYTTRWEENGDDGEIICKYIPQKELIASLEAEYAEEVATVKKNCCFESYSSAYAHKCRKSYEEKSEKAKSDYSFVEFLQAKYEAWLLDIEKSIPSAKDRFWKQLKDEQRNLISENEKVGKDGISPNQYESLLESYFELNPKYTLDLEKIFKTYSTEIEEQKANIPSGENPSYFIKHDEKEYIIYENNKRSDESRIQYGFEIGNVQEKLREENKHIVLTASLPNIFQLCRDHIGSENVVTAFTYSQISAAEHSKHADEVTGKAKLAEYDDIMRYSHNIAEFDYALIFAETSILNAAGGQKDELFDQLSRLFDYYSDNK